MQLLPITNYWIGLFENGVFTPDFEEAKKLELVNGFPERRLEQNRTGSKRKSKNNGSNLCPNSWCVGKLTRINVDIK